MHVSMIIEILGKPADHVKTAITQLVEKLGKEKDVTVLTQKVHEPKEIEENKGLFTSFAEIEVEMESISTYLGIIFAYMPSHIEIITPEKIELPNIELNELGNKLLQRLHDYDAITKKSMMEREQILLKLKEVAPHLFEQPKVEEIPKEKTEKEAKKKSAKKKKN